jgi:hypothetical protein
MIKLVPFIHRFNKYIKFKGKRCLCVEVNNSYEFEVILGYLKGDDGLVNRHVLTSPYNLYDKYKRGDSTAYYIGFNYGDTVWFNGSPWGDFIITFKEFIK